MVKRRSDLPHEIHHGRLASRMWRVLVTDPSPRGGTFCWRPPTNVYEVEDGGLVQVEVAGLSSGSYRVVYADRTLTIEGTRSEPAIASVVACQQMEIASGCFRTAVRLPWEIDTERIRIEYGDGFLRVFVPRHV